jgi:hypothetical protein
LAEGERIQGGACACHVVGQKRSIYGTWIVLLGLGLWCRRMSRRGTRR